MRAFRGLAVVVAGVALLPVSHASADPDQGVPNTLATSRRVRVDEQVESEFPIDFLGVFYEGDADGASVRFRLDRRWGPWIEMEEDGIDVDGRWASGLVPAGDAEAYQVRVPPGAGQPQAVVINTTDGPAQSAADPLATCPDATPVVTRCEWGADEALMTWAPQFYPPQKLTVHHTATANGVADPAATMRAIYRYQAVDRGFGDIGYQYLIDESGSLYEGRYSGDDNQPGHSADGADVVTAAHVGGFNSGNTGIALLGTLTSQDATAAARSTLEGLLGELSARYGIDPRGTSTYVNPLNGATKTVANISGHRDWAATECPGGRLYSQLPGIRDAAAGTPPPTDTTAPVITGVTASARRKDATVKWTTDEASTRLVEHRPRGTSGWTSSTGGSTLATSHSVKLMALTRHTTYEFRVTSVDAVGNATTSAILMFTTT